MIAGLSGAGRSQAADSLEELKELSWLPDVVAEAVYAKVHGSGNGRHPPAN